MNDYDFRGIWGGRQIGVEEHEIIARANKIPGRTVWIQYERNGDAK
jgi:hypothetical protein